MALAFAPTYDRLLDQAARVSPKWADWLLALVTRVNTTPCRLKVVTLTTQTASIGTTALPLGTLTEGMYRVSYAARITTPGTVSSSLTVTIGWTQAVALSQAGAAMTGNTTATQQNGSFLIRVDAATTITYATTYASAGATAMVYRLDVVVEQVPS